MIPLFHLPVDKRFVLKGTFWFLSGERFPVNGIPRFVPAENYADAFGFQWKNFARTQLDSHSGTPITRIRLERCLGFPLISSVERKCWKSAASRSFYGVIARRSTGSFGRSEQCCRGQPGNMGADKVYQLAQASMNCPFRRRALMW